MRSRMEGFEDFARAAMPQLRRLAFAWSRDEHRTDDLVQGALERVCAAWPRVRAADDPFAYSRTVLVRLLLNEQRRPAFRRERVTDDVPDVVVTGPDVDARLDLAALVGRLPERQRLVVLLRFVEDLPVAEVARLLGCSDGTVKSQSHAALATLRRWSAPRPVTGAHR